MFILYIYIYITYIYIHIYIYIYVCLLFVGAGGSALWSSFLPFNLVLFTFLRLEILENIFLIH